MSIPMIMEPHTIHSVINWKWNSGIFPLPGTSSLGFWKKVNLNNKACSQHRKILNVSVSLCSDGKIVKTHFWKINTDRKTDKLFH